MRKFRLISDADFGLEIKEMDNPTVRYAARGIVINNDKIAVLHKKNKNEYKLIGGGVEKDELYDVAFKREVKEEAGATLKNIWLLGIIQENRTHDNFQQISYVYVGDVENIGETEYTDKEKDEGAEILWVSIDKALDLIKDCENEIIPSKYENMYHSKFIVRRDYEILKYYQKMINND